MGSDITLKANLDKQKLNTAQLIRYIHHLFNLLPCRDARARSVLSSQILSGLMLP